MEVKAFKSTDGRLFEYEEQYKTYQKLLDRQKVFEKEFFPHKPNFANSHSIMKADTVINWFIENWDNIKEFMKKHGDI